MAELAGFARVVERVSGWQNLCGLCFHKFQSFIQWADRDAADLNGVHLLEAREGARFCGVAKCSHGAERNKFSAQSTDLKIEDLVLVEAIGAADLGNHFIAAAVDIEAVYEVPTDAGGNIRADFGEIQSERGHFVAINGELGLRLVVFQANDRRECKKSALGRLVLQDVCKFQNLFCWGSRGDNDLDRKITSSRKGGGHNRKEPKARNGVELVLHAREDLECGPLSLTPWH